MHTVRNYEVSVLCGCPWSGVWLNLLSFCAAPVLGIFLLWKVSAPKSLKIVWEIKINVAFKSLRSRFSMIFRSRPFVFERNSLTGTIWCFFFLFLLNNFFKIAFVISLRCLNEVWLILAYQWYLLRLAVDVECRTSLVLNTLLVS